MRILSISYVNPAIPILRTSFSPFENPALFGNQFLQVLVGIAGGGHRDLFETVFETFYGASGLFAIRAISQS